MQDGRALDIDGPLIISRKVTRDLGEISCGEMETTRRASTNFDCLQFRLEI